MVEEYCWAITPAAGRTCCGRSGSGVLEFGFQPDCVVCEYVCFGRMYVQFGLGAT